MRANGNGANGAEVEKPPQPAVMGPIATGPVVHHEPLLVQLKRVKPAEFEGSTNPLVAQGWFKTIENTLNLMGLTDNEKVLCVSYCLTMDARIWWESMELKYNVNEMTWEVFTREFNEQYFNMNITREHYDEFNDLRQGDRIVTEAVTKFNYLARLCPSLVPYEREKVRRMIRMFCLEIAVHVDNGVHPPTTVAECYR